jgi:hypothetical protein
MPQVRLPFQAAHRPRPYLSGVPTEAVDDNFAASSQKKLAGRA